MIIDAIWMAVSSNWGCFSSVSLEEERYCFRAYIRALTQRFHTHSAIRAQLLVRQSLRTGYSEAVGRVVFDELMAVRRRSRKGRTSDHSINEKKMMNKQKRTNAMKTKNQRPKKLRRNRRRRNNDKQNDDNSHSSSQNCNTNHTQETRMAMTMVTM